MITGRDRIAEHWRTAMANHRLVVQALAQGVVDSIHGQLTGRWHFSDHGWRCDGSAALLLAHYQDEYAEEPQGLLFKRRTLVRHYHGPLDLSSAAPTPTS